jgi:hypothetical protein
MISPPGKHIDLNCMSFPAQLGDDGLNHHVFQKVHTITDGNDLRFEVSVRYPAPGRYTFVLRWTQRENDGSNCSIVICKADFELLAAEVPTDAESLFLPLRSLPVSSGGGNPCEDEFHCSDEYRKLCAPSEGTMERLDQISAEQVLAETCMIRISIDAPLTGQTLVPGGKTEAKISINVENGSSGPCEDLELRVMAHSDNFSFATVSRTCASKCGSSEANLHKLDQRCENYAWTRDMDFDCKGLSP